VSARANALALALLPAVLCAGCGAAASAPDATGVARDFQAALHDQDGPAACSQLSENTAKALEADEQKPCEEAILDLDLPTGTEVAGARVYVTSASVEVLVGARLFLEEAADGWQISAAGCKPTEADLPLDCELED
jgi:hypothetical protein